MASVGGPERTRLDAIVVNGSFGGSVERRSLLDRAHRGDLEGAFGRIRAFDTGPRTSLARRLGTLLAVMGPGVIVMVADNDAGSISVYAQAGQNHGLSLLWPFALLAPVLYVLQEMVARLGAVTGAGHARLIFERFGRRWGSFALGDLLALNFLTLVTEFVGVDFAARALDLSRYLAVPAAAALLLAIVGTGRFRNWERAVSALVLVNLVAVPLALLGRTQPGAPLHTMAVSHGGFRSGGALFAIAVVGAAVSPWQLFFQQSNVVDKRITARWLRYERVDTLVGAVLFTVVGAALVVACAFAFDGTPLHGRFVDLGTVTHALSSRLGASAGALFALLLLNGSVLCAAVVTLTTSYALGDVLGTRHSLHRGWRDARFFHGSFAAAVIGAAAVELAPGMPLGAVTTLVQALAGILLPSAAVFLLLLCNDRAVLGPWINPRWLNGLTTALVGVLLALSGLLTATLVEPRIDLRVIAVVLGASLAAALAVLAAVAVRRDGLRQRPAATPWQQNTWTTPPLETLPPPAASRARTLGLVALRAYLIVTALLLAAKAIRLALGA